MIPRAPSPLSRGRPSMMPFGIDQSWILGHFVDRADRVLFGRHICGAVVPACFFAASINVATIVTNGGERFGHVRGIHSFIFLF